MAKIIKFFLYMIVFCPFMMAKFTFFPFVTGENLFIRFILVLISILFLFNFLIKNEFKKEIVYKLKNIIKNRIFISILVFILVSSISVILAVNKYNALWGTIERSEGLVGLVYIFSFLFFSLLIFNKKDWINFFKLSLFIFFIFLIKEFSQYFHGTYRPSSFLDNPTFLSGYLLFAVFCSLSILNECRNRFWKYFSIMMIILSISGILLTGTRGTLIGVFMGIFFVALYFFIKGKNIILYKISLRSVSIIILIILTLFSSIFLLTKNNKIWQDVPGLNRLILISSQDSTTQTRLILTEVGIQAINPKENGIKKFLIGWGLDNFSLAYSKYFNINQFKYEIGWFDRSHNKLVDILVMSGLLGLLAYLSIYFFYFKNIFKNKNFSLQSVGSVFFGVSLFVHLFFVFDHTTTLISLYAVLSYFIYLDTFKDNDILMKVKNYSPSSIEIWSVGSVFSILLIMFLFIFLRNDLQSYLQMRKYIILKQNPNKEYILKNINNVFAPFTPAQMNIRKDSFDFIKSYIGDSNFTPLLDVFDSKANEYLRKNPSDVRFLIYLASSYSNLGKESKNEQLIIDGEKYFREALKFSPNRSDLHYGLAMNLFFQKKYDESFYFFEKSFNDSPNIYKKNETDIQKIYIDFFKYFYEGKDKNNLLKVLNRLKTNNFKDSEMVNNILEFIEKNNRWPNIIFK